MKDCFLNLIMKLKLYIKNRLPEKDKQILIYRNKKTIMKDYEKFKEDLKREKEALKQKQEEIKAKEKKANIEQTEEKLKKMKDEN